MGWMIVTAVCICGAAWALWRCYQLKKEVYRFADRTERALDAIIAGGGMEEGEEFADSLWGKVGEKLQRVNHIWKKREETSVREKEKIKELISDISHQTRTPLANMRLYMEFLQEEECSEKGKEFLENLEKQTDKLDFLLLSMVKMSRLETGIIQIQSYEDNLYETIGRAMAAVVPGASKKELALYVDCPEKFFIAHDKKWTEEAIFNVLDNAVKYTPPRGEICVTVTRQEMFVKISVRDTGKGIALERQAEIFTRFYREPEVHDQPGVGIGLYLARKILELQSGYIEVRSQAEQGAEFCMYLPWESCAGSVGHMQQPNITGL